MPVTGTTDKGGRKEQISEKKLAAVRENIKKAQAAYKHKLETDPIAVMRRDMRERLGRALSLHGLEHVERIIEEGPGEGDSDKAGLWQFCMNFAGDRGGMPRVAQVDVEVDAIPGIRVELPDFPKPSDV